VVQTIYNNPNNIYLYTNTKPKKFMAQIKEKLETEVVERLKQNQAQANEAVLNLGQAELRIIELKAELAGVEKFKEDVIISYKTSVDVLNGELKVLEGKYPSGEVDLTEGVVIFDDGK
jgi:uncharacterized protein involved in exopolysaccharide biosynthesis